MARLNIPFFKKMTTVVLNNKDTCNFTCINIIMEILKVFFYSIKDDIIMIFYLIKNKPFILVNIRILINPVI